jgi:hypothetical protein
MTDNPDPRAGKMTAIPISDVPHAPFIFYENAPALGFTNGVVNITLVGKQNLRGTGWSYRK